MPKPLAVLAMNSEDARALWNAAGMTVQVWEFPPAAAINNPHIPLEGDQHLEEIDRGLHDDECEYGRKSADGAILRLCHCSKRRREQAGFTTPPTDDVEWQPPTCPRCHEDLHHNGDGFQCDKCCLMWDSNGRGFSCRFFDDYGVLTLEASGASGRDA